MIETILHGIQKGINAATPWLVGTAAGFFLLWLALLIREKKPFERELKWFAALTPFGKSAVMLMLGFFTWWGGAKERGASSPSANDDVSPTPSRVVETVQPRSLPEEISTNALRITAFSINQTNQTAYFETRCATNLFDHTASRNLYLFLSTNLLERRWTPLCMIQMPANTNVHSFVVAQSDVMPSMRHWFLDSFGGVGFYRFGADFDSDGDGVADDIERLWTFTDPDKFDTDGDGLSDGQELSYQVNTNPLAYDTDGDGVGDGDEVASGSNPRRDNSDLDELTDAQELGTMTALVENDFMWFDMSGGTDLLSGYSTLNSYSKEIPLASETVVNDVCYTNARVCLDGTVYLLCPTNLTGGYYYYSNLSNIQWSASHLTVALCGANLYARTSDWGSKILYGSLVSEGRSFDVVEYRNMGLYDHNDTNELITCQLMLPHDETNTIYVSYLCASNTFRDVSFAAGIQCGWIPSNKSGERFYNLSWPIVGDFPQDGLTIKYSIGTCTDPTKTDTDDDGLSDSDETLLYNTNPRVADTDGDGIPDGIEVSIGTDPNSVDTDEDGMPDGWEVYYELNPLVDDSALDLDNDGLPNYSEYAAGTNPAEEDTDEDGIGDRDELGWWEHSSTLSAFSCSSVTNLISSTKGYDDDLFLVTLPFEVRFAGYRATKAKVSVNGFVWLITDIGEIPTSSDYSNQDLSTNARSQYHGFIAAYWDDLYAYSGHNAQLSVSDAYANGQRYCVIKYQNISIRNDESNMGTFRVVIPANETNTVYVAYDSLSSGFNGSSATIGAQSPKKGCNFPVAYNESGSVSNGMVIAYHFGTGSNPLMADTDGDGLEDGDEVAIGTIPAAADTDNDGLSDYWEYQNGLDPLSPSGGNGADGDPDGDHLTNAKELAYGTDPSSPDTDSDGLLDSDETGCIFVTNAVPWMTFNESEDITAAISSANRRCVNWPTPIAMAMQGETVTNVTISANGLLFFNRAGYVNQGDSTSGESFRYEVDDDALVIAPYLEYTYFRTDIPGYETAVKVGTSTYNGEGYLLVEFDNAFRNTSTWQTNAVSFQISVPTNHPTCAYVRYKKLSGQYMTGDYASIGMQTFESRWLHSYCDDDAGKIWENLCLEFLFGVNSNPLMSDTDEDGLSDGMEVNVGTSPAKTDTDGDELPDNWEVLNNLDPLSVIGDDGASGDPDGDGVDNYAEYELGTNPNLADTDNDGLSDGKEVVCVSFAGSLPWLEISTLTNVTVEITNGWNQAVCWNLPAPIYVQCETVTNITIDKKGIVLLNRSGYADPELWHNVSDLENYAVDTNCFTVVPYGRSLYFYGTEEPSAIKIGTAEHAGRGYIVVEYDNMHHYEPYSSTNAISFQVAIPTGRVERISVSYANRIGNDTDGRSASVGCQSFGADDRVSYCRYEQGKIYGGMSIAFMVGYGSNPLVADTDGDGISDSAEVNTYGSDPTATDTDADGLPDAQEAALGTSLNNPDSDGDGLLDGWEVSNSLNPLSAVGNDGADGDIDNDTLTNIQEQEAGSNPRNADTDNDGLSDSDEVEAGTNPALADTDHDGLSDGLEDSIDTNPLQPDSDSDGMNDGWEYRYGFDPTVNNASDNDPDNDIGADPDGDGLTNGQECNFGTDPLDSDTDGDGVSDGAEVGQNSDPTDSADGGQPNSRVPAPFTFGDPSGSHSEKYTLEVTPVSGDGETPSSFSWLNENYGQCETKIAMLKPGWKYEVRLYHSGTNGSGDGYPDYDYELDFAGNDTTDGVIKDDPDGLFGTDYTSDSFAGEGKVAYVYALAPPKLVPDYNRDRAITDDDVNKVMQKKKLRFWINDDEDDDSTDGKYAESPSVDIPGALTGWWFEFDGRDPDWNDSKVNGYRDLIDFTPVFMDVSTIQMLPERIRNSLTFKLSHAAGAVNVVWSDLPKSSVGLFQRGNVGVCGRNLNEDSYEAETERVGADGIAVPDALVAQMKSSSSNKGVVFIEGREATSAPLKLDIYYNGQKVVTGELPMDISSVEEMYWFYSLHGAEKKDNFELPDRYTPGNLMGNPKDRDVFFTHGFNVSENDARAWGSEVFKRLWQSGSDARIHMVAWPGNYHWTGNWANGLHYQRDVYQALKSANAFKRLVEREQGDSTKRVIMAQSLGNMMACEAFRQGLAASQYFMFDAAVATEAINAIYQNNSDATRNKYVPSDWHPYDSKSWAANWHTWFTNDVTDARGKMGWPDYFKTALTNVGSVYNYYSTGDPVFMENDTVPDVLTGVFHWPTFGWSWWPPGPTVQWEITAEANCWQKQETHKGVEPIAGNLRGGWGFYWWMESSGGEDYPVYYSAATTSVMVANGSITNNPVFYYPGTQMDNRNATQDNIWFALAEYVPAVSSPVGGNSTAPAQVENHDLNGSPYRSGWGRNDGVYLENWFHSDMKDMAYFYVYPLYDELKTKGSLK